MRGVGWVHRLTGLVCSTPGVFSMTIPSSAHSRAPFTSPIGTDGPRVALYTPEFAADPHRAYRDMRERYGALVPVDLAPGVPATLVVGYYSALQILNDPDHFPAD